MDTMLQELSSRVGEALLARGWLLATAESCTGGWVAETITAIAGSSDWFDRGFITYSNNAKIGMLGVNPETLIRHGAVSEATVAEMTAGALIHSTADIAVAISGIAGPTGGSPAKSVGTVCIARQIRYALPEITTCHFTGDREAIRRQSVIFTLESILTAALAHPCPPLPLFPPPSATTPQGLCDN